MAPTTHTRYADIVLPIRLPQTFTYIIPPQFENIDIGYRVIIPFGNSKIQTGFIQRIHEDAPEAYETKEILDVLDESPIMTPEQFRFYQWIADYYLCTIGEVINAGIPTGLKISSETNLQLHPDYQDNLHGIEISEKETQVIDALQDNASLNLREIQQVLGVKGIHKTVKSLRERKAVVLFEQLRDKYTPKTEKWIYLHADYHSEEKLEQLSNSLQKKTKQLEVLIYYLNHLDFNDNKERLSEGITKKALKPFSPSSIKTMVKHGIFEEKTLTISRFPEIKEVEAAKELDKAQQVAKESILNQFEEKEAVLLHGITGSGKTEIYIDLIQEAIDNGNQVLYLLPEIALTTQIVGRLKKVFGDKLGVFHSKYSDNERVEVWQGVLEGKFPIVVGVRSSIFLPFNNLGLIIIDEEHDSSFKQFEPSPRYNARDAALMLAKLYHAKTILGTATPSVESLYHSQTGNLGYVKLDRRFGGASLPDILLADVTRSRKKLIMTEEFTPELMEAMNTTLAAGEQVILFQNRRGYAPYISCNDCQEIPKCINCDVSLTYHRYKQELHCHYCGHKEAMHTECSSCGSPQIQMVNYGTEKLEEDVQRLFPNYQTLRMDLDTTRNKHAYEKIINRFEKKEIDILIGTQMVTKGLDFNHVGLVGIFDIDRIIHYPDYRSKERAFQIITQVSGRAGRKEKKGKVIIQTRDTKQEVFQLVIANGIEQLYQDEIQERKLFEYPPFVRLIRITVKNLDRNACEYTTRTLRSRLLTVEGIHKVSEAIEPGISFIRNKHIREISIKLVRLNPKNAGIKKLIERLCQLMVRENNFKRSQISIDVDPA